MKLDWPAIIMCGIVYAPVIIYYVGGKNDPEYLRLLLRIGRYIWLGLLKMADVIQKWAVRTRERIDKLEGKEVEDI